MPDSVSATSGPSAVDATGVRGRPTYSGHQVFRPVKHRLRFSELWTSTSVARMAALRDVRIKYKQSVLGPIWLVLQPLGLLGALLVAFAGIAEVSTGGVSSLLFTIVGVTVWTFTQQTIGTGATALISNASLVRRSICPRVALVTGSLLGNVPTLAVMTALSLILTVIIEGVVVQMLLVPLLAVWLIGLLWGPALLIAGVATRFRDAVAVVPLLLQAGIFLTPIGYSIDGAPGALQVALWINPITGVMEAWRWAILDVDPVLGAVGVSALWTIGLAFIGWAVFSRLETAFADYL